jgi:FKBP-type peptidyl-prolyl cis-trans isomerase 2
VLHAVLLVQQVVQLVTSLTPNPHVFAQSRKVRLDPSDGYGEVDPELVMSFPAAQAPQGLQAGMRVQLSNGMTATCTKMDDKEVCVR